MITSNRSFFIVILLFFAMSMFSYLHADINAELTISEPEEDFFRPREIMTAFLVLTNDDGDTLWFDEAEENGIQIVELSVSGPRQHYVSLEDYFRLEIVSGREGLIEDSGFDPDLNLIEIEIPRNIGDYGTYSIVFWIQREVDDEEFNVFPTIDFQLGQLAQTFTPSDRYKTCIECHDSPECTETHNDNINNCVKCHTRDIDLAFNGF
ncbi:hypothetical protein H8D57_02665, partial [bacterium]|nr:hypothetical protein [bacterium]